MIRVAGVPLLWKVFAGNALVLLVATLALVLTPATVSFPIALEELVVLTVGLALMLCVDVALLRRALRPLAALAAFARAVDPLTPGQRVELPAGDPEVRDVAAAVDEMLDRLEAERRESARRALVAQEAERVRIARELHDEVGQALTAVLWMVEGDAREAVRDALEDVRGIARRLRPEALDDLGLTAALATLTVSVQRAGGVRIERELDGEAAARLSADEELVVYRVAQEALTNVVRHAGARRATVTLRSEAAEVVLEVADDGRGIDGAADGTGIRGMRERALLVGARLAVGPGPDGGTVVRLGLAR
jgi:two-component system sensor histidine kinase UhpB